MALLPPSVSAPLQFFLPHYFRPPSLTSQMQNFVPPTRGTFLVVITALVVVATGLASYFMRQWREASAARRDVVPIVSRTGSGRISTLERFSDYVVRQMGFVHAGECPLFCRLANNYLRTLKMDEEIFTYLSKLENAESVYVKMVEELECCILSYFGFHWCHTPAFITQALKVDSEHSTKLKDAVLAATRKQRFERVTKELKTRRMFSTLVDEMKVIERISLDITKLAVTEDSRERRPVLLFMGGGMGAGKSTVLKDILQGSFWRGAAKDAVVIEADALKENDVIYKALNSSGHHDDMLETSEHVHESSTEAASSLLVTALNRGRDVIMDGTLSWEPFVVQTIAMARDVHRCRYRMGIGYKPSDGGAVVENYWEPDPITNKGDDEKGEEERKPYRIELVGVLCDAHLAVVRAIRRAIMMRRAVRVNQQLRSHKRFAMAFKGYCDLVDNARLYTTNSIAGPPTLVGWKEGEGKLVVEEAEEMKWLERTSKLNVEADCVYHLYKDESVRPVVNNASIWCDVVLSPSRKATQLELIQTIHSIEKHSL